MLPKQAVSFAQLRSEGLAKKEITALYSGLKLFPTPFKGIYYVPLEEERKGEFIEKPMKALTQAISLFLGSNEFYYSCRTADEALGIEWRPSGSVHVVNGKVSRKIDLRKKIELNKKKGNWRAKKIATILSLYGNEVVFHKTRITGGEKTRETPNGRVALKVQIKKDKERFEARAFASKEGIIDEMMFKDSERALRKAKEGKTKLQRIEEIA